MPPDIRLRALKPADAARVQDFVRGLSARTRRERYFAPIRELSERQLARVIHPGRAADVALGAFAAGELIGLAECSNGEFAIVVTDAWQGLGLGEGLLLGVLGHAREQRLLSLYGLVRAGNRAMLRLAARLGFRATRDEDPDLLRVAIGL